MIKPQILIYASETDTVILKEICAGIEEEGVSWEVVGQVSKGAEDLAYDSSNASSLGTGLGYSNGVIVLSLNSLPKGSYVYRVEKPTIKQARILGTNAARAVKRKPFIEVTNEVTKP